MITLAKFLIQNEDKYYTVVDALLVEASVTELNAQAFQTYGFDDLPDGALIKTLSHPKLLYWQESGDDLPMLTATVTATPPPQYIEKVIYRTDPSITGIDNVKVTCEGNVRFSCSFDGGTTFVQYDGSSWVEQTDGMNKETIEAITSDEWNSVTNIKESFIMRVILAHDTDILTELRVNFTNE